MGVALAKAVPPGDGPAAPPPYSSPMRAATHIGVDEAGLGPNLGPLVVVAMRWEGLLGSTDDLWRTLSAAVTQDREEAGKLLIGDSKLVYRDRRDGATLHAAADGLLRAAGVEVGSLQDVVVSLDPEAAADFEAAPWFAGEAAEVSGTVAARLDVLSTVLEAEGATLSVAAAVVPAGRFNRLLADSAGKGDLLSRLSLATLRRVWTPGEPAAVWCDKHGGRNAYAQHLTDVCGGEFVQVLSEGKAESRYAVGDSRIAFGVRSERHFPVACASIVAKSVRQRCMAAFNAFWSRHDPGLKPTEGYPTDAKRFAEETAALRRSLGIADDLFWRSR